MQNFHKILRHWRGRDFLVCIRHHPFSYSNRFSFFSGRPDILQFSLFCLLVSVVFLCYFLHLLHNFVLSSSHLLFFFSCAPLKLIRMKACNDLCSSVCGCDCYLIVLPKNALYCVMLPQSRVSAFAIFFNLTAEDAVNSCQS